MFFPTQSNTGSSPLTRGKRHVSPEWIGRIGLIPAHAGKTQSRRRGCGLTGAHPRSRGENMARESGSGVDWGSSPLTRGKRGEDRRDGHTGGLIPAHAGKTPPDPLACHRRRAHPRSRGENILCPKLATCLHGSSPLTRGKPLTSEFSRPRARLIPAHAGKTAIRLRPRSSRTAHPRSRGENWSSLAMRAGEMGSSPLTRGKLVGLLGRRLRAGLIPAHAGKTPWDAYTLK